MPLNHQLVAARRLVWEKEIWREPARIFHAISALKEMVSDEMTSTESRAEAEYLIKTLYLLAKPPAP